MNLMNFRLMAAGAASVLALAGAATADEASTSPAITLRALGAQVDLHIGTAATPLDLSDPTPVADHLQTSSPSSPPETR